MGFSGTVFTHMSSISPTILLHNFNYSGHTALWRLNQRQLNCLFHSLFNQLLVHLFVCWGIYWWPVDSPYIGLMMCFHLMASSWLVWYTVIPGRVWNSFYSGITPFGMQICYTERIILFFFFMMQLWQYYTILHVYESPNRYKVSAYYITCQDLYMHSYLPTYPVFIFGTAKCGGGRIIRLISTAFLDTQS